MKTAINKMFRYFLTNLKSVKFADDLVTKGFKTWYEIPVDPTHYYSPLPNMSMLKQNLHRWYQESSMAGIELALDKQMYILEQLKTYKEECRLLQSFAQITENGYGPGYGEVEAHLLHCMIRYLKPKSMIEVGSGVSTYFTLQALRKNQQDDGQEFVMSCIEPYPANKLQRLAETNNLNLQVNEVQDIPVTYFQQLDNNDILFIDSSHVSKVDSDINYLYLEILPQLKKGVVVHIHDIPFPYATCNPGHPTFPVSLLWNESALVRALLMYNGVFDIIMCQSYLHYKYPESIKAVVDIYDQQKHFPTSLWLRKVV